MIEMVRVAVTEDGAFGVLLKDGKPFAVTLERTYPREGGGLETKIPAGRWPCSRSWFYRGQHRTFEIHVPGHERLLFHRANTQSELDGCIAVGEKFADFDGQVGIGESALGFHEFMDRTAGVEEFDLTVTDIGGPPGDPAEREGFS